ncbi:MAG: TldD/PmbA family protein [Bacteroidales bacterium]|nr:TldD/PmbA family protein [Bacteroidales bacterium]MCL2132853.1 TldD/PmbA family protein [Bacteroidales bacterium]
MERRDFLKTCGVTVAGAVLLPHLLGSCDSGAKEGVALMLSHFGVTENDLKKIMAAALENGGDYVDLFFEHTFGNSLSLRDGAVNRASSAIDFGMGVRVIVGDQTGYAYVENITMAEMLKAARTASRIASSGQKTTSVNISEKIFPNYYPIVNSWEDVSVKDKAPYVQKLNDRCFALDKRTSKVTVSQSDTTSYILFCNSEGVLCHDYRPMVTLSAFCIMEDNGKIENFHSARSFRKGVEFLTDDVVEVIAREAVEGAARMFTAVKPKGGEMPVVMAAGGSGILLHEAIGHAFEADFNRKNISIFSDLLNKQICDTHINIVDDGTIAGNRGSTNFDDEGTASQKTYIVTNGVLTSYLHDRISAKHYGIASTGNGRRESFRHTPMPRMRCTYMENGNFDEQEIIADVKKGIYAANFTNGQVQIGAGDFTFFVKSGYLIENGKLTQPIKDINIIGNGPKALADISMVGRNLKLDDSTWTCGKDGQGMPVTQGLPSVLVKKLTVGGE